MAIKLVTSNYIFFLKFSKKSYRRWQLFMMVWHGMKLLPCQLSLSAGLSIRWKLLGMSWANWEEEFPEYDPMNHWPFYTNSHYFGFITPIPITVCLFVMKIGQYKALWSSYPTRLERLWEFIWHRCSSHCAGAPINSHEGKEKSTGRDRIQGCINTYINT